MCVLRHRRPSEAVVSDNGHTPRPNRPVRETSIDADLLPRRLLLGKLPEESGNQEAADDAGRGADRRATRVPTATVVALESARIRGRGGANEERCDHEARQNLPKHFLFPFLPPPKAGEKLIAK